MATKAFLDSNILIYAIGPESAKAARARDLLALGPTISVQVLNEFINVARRKLKQDWSTVDEGLAAAHDFCEIVPLTLETYERAVEIARESKINIFDASIIAAAELAGCGILLSEDLNHGQRIGRVHIQNPFLAS